MRGALSRTREAIGMWIKGIDDLIQTDAIDSVYAGWNLITEPVTYDLLATYRSGNRPSIIDRFDDEEPAKAARDWFYLLLTGAIKKEQWEAGRTDVEAR